MDGPAGSEFVTDNMALLRVIRMPEDFVASPTEETPPHVTSKVLFDVPDKDDENPENPKTLDAEHLQILVAEDDPINSRIIQKRLEESGHTVHHTVNGEECASAYGEKSPFFDVVFMDMQVSITPSSNLF